MVVKKMKDISATHSMGGIVECMETGIYPNYLTISSLKFKKSWNIKVKKNVQTGVLKVKRSIVLRYTYNGIELKIQEVNENTSGNDWIKINVDLIMCD